MTLSRQILLTHLRQISPHSASAKGGGTAWPQRASCMSFASFTSRFEYQYGAIAMAR